MQRKQGLIWQNKVICFFLAPSLLGVGIFTAIPFLDVFRRSFLEAYGGKFAGLENYGTVLQNEAFLLAVKNTGRFIVICVPLLLLISLLLALAVQSLQGNLTKKIFQALFLLPMAIPVASIVLFWKLLFEKNGFLNQLIGGICGIFQTASFGMHGDYAGFSLDWMNGASAFYVLVFSYIWKNTGYFVVLWMAGLNEIPVEYYEAAKVDGAGGWTCFQYITLPGLVPSFFIVSVLAFVNSFKVFREAYLIAGDYPHESIYMLQHVFNNWFVSLDIQKLSAAAVLLVLVIGGIIGGLLLLEKHFTGGES